MDHKSPYHRALLRQHAALVEAGGAGKEIVRPTSYLKTLPVSKSLKKAVESSMKSKGLGKSTKSSSTKKTPSSAKKSSKTAEPMHPLEKKYYEHLWDKYEQERRPQHRF